MKNKKRKKFNGGNNNQGNKGNKNNNNGKKSYYVDKNKGNQNNNGNNKNNNNPYVKEETFDNTNKPVYEKYVSKFDEVEEEIEQLELDEDENLVEEIKNIADEEVSSDFEDDYYRNNNSYQNDNVSNNTSIFEKEIENDIKGLEKNNENDDIEIDILEELDEPEYLDNNIFETSNSIDRANQLEFYNSYNDVNKSEEIKQEEIVENDSQQFYDTGISQNDIVESNDSYIENDIVTQNADNQNDNDNNIIQETDKVFEKDEDVYIERENDIKADDSQNHFDKWYNENIEDNNDEEVVVIDDKESSTEVENTQFNESEESVVEDNNDFELKLNQEQQEKLLELFENNESYNYKISNGNLKNGIINRNEANEIIEEYNIDIPKNVSHDDEEYSSSNNNVTASRIYLSFQARISILVCCILLLLGSAFTLIIKSAVSQEVKNVGYEETTSVEYSACLDSSDPYKIKCLDSKEKYNASSIKNMKATFTYKVKFDEEVNHNISYYVVLVNKIYDKSDKKNVVYENEDVILDKEVEDINSDNATLDIDINIDFKEYNDFATNYVKKYTNSSDATIDAILYITEGEETRKVATLSIPLMKNDFKVSSTLVSKDRYTAEIVLKEWTDKDTVGVVFGIIFVLIAIVLIIRLAKLVMSTITKKSAYEVKLQEILNEYDRMIVVARDGYASETVMKVVKVDSFEKLLDMREIFNKPIIYSKVNNVKSEFIVEDEDTIYKYVMKEADIN